MHMTHNPLISFELMPPRRPHIAPNFWKTVDDLMAYRPDFVSVTYGAGGKDHSTSLETVARLVCDTPVRPIAHLTCVGSPRDDLARIVESYLDAGVRTFLALRGDPPANDPTWKPSPEHVASACELISLMREVEAENVARSSAARLRNAFKPLTIAVATFPNGNPAAGTTAEQEAYRLLEKQEAGANFAITQLFWDVECYGKFVEYARQIGVDIPIIPGLLPATDPARIRRTTELTGIEAPTSILDHLESAPSPEATYQRGVQIGARMLSELLEQGAPGVHLYSFNKSRPSLDLLEAANISSWTSTITPNLKNCQSHDR